MYTILKICLYSLNFMHLTLHTLNTKLKQSQRKGFNFKYYVKSKLLLKRSLIKLVILIS